MPTSFKEMWGRVNQSDEELEEASIKNYYQEAYKQGTKVTIEMSVPEISKNHDKYGCIKCKGSLGKYSADWAIASGDFSRLSSSLKGEEGNVNILEHISKLIPSSGEMVGLITYQNGIQNSYDEFVDMGQSILKQFGKNMNTSHLINFREYPLCIGLYNPMSTLLFDTSRVSDHLQDKETPTVYRTRLMLGTLLNLLEKINPNLHWLHIVHSEAGAITYRAIKNMTTEQQESLSPRMLIGGYGPAMPIPAAFAKKVWNVYSDKDTTTGHMGRKYNQLKYNIEFLPSEMEGSFILPPGDHAFQGDTYRKALIKHLDWIRGKYGFYPKKK